MASKVELMYGKGHVEVEIDEGIEVVVVEKPPMPLLDSRLKIQGNKAIFII